MYIHTFKQININVPTIFFLVTVIDSCVWIKEYCVEVRLRGKGKGKDEERKSAGRVELRRKSKNGKFTKWGTLCDDYFDKNINGAHVI